MAEEEELRTSPMSIPMDPHPEVDVHEMPSWALVSDVMLLRLTSGAVVEAPVRSLLAVLVAAPRSMRMIVP